MKNRGWGLGAGGRENRGFTIIELILTTVLVSITIFGTASIIMRGLDAYAQARERRQAVNAARHGVDRMVRDLRQIASPATFILLANATTFRYATQLVPLNFVTYQVQGNQLLLDGNLLVGNVVPGSGFSYFNAAGLPAVGLVDIARVNINLTVNTSVAAYGSVVINTDVYLRNRYYQGFSQP